MSYKSEGNLARAVRDYGEAIRLNPEDMDAYNLRGGIYARNGDVDLALADYEKRYELGGSSVVQGAQSYLWDKGHYRGKLDGVYGEVMRRALRACIADPKC